MSTLCNARVLNAPLTGVQRYTKELLVRLPEIDVLMPGKEISGARGHLWEQSVLPWKLKSRTLWSPSNTGPISVTNQIVTVHDLSTFDTPDAFSPAFRQAYAFILPRLLPRVKAILTVSTFSKSCIAERFSIPEDKIFVTPLGVEHKRFYPRTRNEIDAIKAKLNIEKDYVLFLGTLSARKNMAGLMKAWQMAEHEIPDNVELLIAGGAGAAHVFDGTTLPRLPPRVRLLPRIDDEDLPALLSGATVFAFPSFYEGFGLPPLEAMACGAPVLTSNTTSLPEVVGNCAITINPKEPEEIGQGLLALLKDENRRNDMSNRGLSHTKEFDWNKTAELTRRVLDDASHK